MTKLLSRRDFLASASALGAASLLHPLPSVAAQTRRLSITRRVLDVNGKAANVFGLGSPDGGRGVTLDPGQRFALTLDNRCGEPTIVHWHGQTPPPAQDGVTDTGYATPIADGGSQDYDFAPRPGTHWMHSHHGLQEQNLLAAPLIVRTNEDVAADRQEVVVLFHDFSFRAPEEILASLTSGTAMAGHGGMAMPGMGAQASPAMPGMGMQGQQGMAMQGMAGHMMPGMGGQPMPGMGGQPGGMSAMPGMGMGGMGSMPGMAGMAGMDLNDVEYDAYLANDRTLDDPEVVRTEPGGRVLLRLINGATSTAFWIDLGGATADAVAVDGNPVVPLPGRRFPLAQGQRLDLLVTVPAGGAVPVLAQREGDRPRTGIVLAAKGASVSRIASEAAQPAGPVDLSLEARLSAATPPAAREAAGVHRIALTGAMMPYLWSIDGRSWEDRLPLRVRSGDRVLVQMENHSMMAHPMHLHGHHFQVVGLNGQSLSGAVRDTVLVPPMNRVDVAFDADNAGRWLFHCHNLYHMATGMMTEVVYDGIA